MTYKTEAAGYNDIRLRLLFDTIDRRRIKDTIATKASGRDGDITKEPSPVIREKMYLEACHIFLCPSIPAGQAAQCKKMIRIAGGIHLAEYDPMEVTHVLVPSSELEPG